MRILIIQDQLRIGGTERQSLFLARIFREMGHEAGILTFRPGGHLGKEENVKGLAIRTLQAFDSKVSLWAPGLRRTVQSLAPDVILCMGRTANCYAGFLQKTFPNIPVVGTVRTGKRLFPLHKWSLSRVQAILVNANWWKNKLLEENFAEDRLHVIHNALLLDHSPEELSGNRQQKRRDLNIADGCCVFLNVATFRRGKRHMELLRAFSRLNETHPALDWRLWLVGDGREYERCRKYAAGSTIAGRVSFFHFQRNPLPFYAAADVAVSTSREDSLPNFLIESQAAGLPVIACDYRGVKETCIPGKTGVIFEPGNEGQLISLLHQFASDKEQRSTFSRDASSFARSQFSKESNANKTLAVLMKLVKRAD